MSLTCKSSNTIEQLPDLSWFRFNDSWGAICAFKKEEYKTLLTKDLYRINNKDWPHYFSLEADFLKDLIPIFAALAKGGEVDEWLKSVVC